ncbi:hypothetical protein SAMN02745945_02825 [Peptoclostridium litorale DSM 5388]|uniref:Uncharacterized protein n=1 Tax=Peptoclostridium litorale DSM 5388 TaxID=1121324 RepID=A0A069RL44_PEPLI|nr:hypothetical protein [Peptoclostridium litorale]KDR94937.1 hypothetical protein CLIT_12c00050 [Peptoclostridium litorale DSM 5388]SIO34075.1 hypothetical protein SAMN02745945_02825 [Peptoclostridium litorale DSM 5388]
MIRKEAKRFFSVLMTMLMVLSVFSGSVATLYSVDAYSAPYTYWFEEGTGGATGQKVIKMKFPGKTVSGVVKSDIDVNDAYAEATANYAYTGSGDTITISFADIGYKDGGYELTFNPGAITFSNFTQPVAYTVEFFARDINPGAQTLFVDSSNTSHTNDEILARNTFDDITLTYEGETITEVDVAHEQLEASTDANYLTNITVKTIPEVQKLKIKFVGTTVSKDEEMLLYSTEGGSNVDDSVVTANVFKTSIVGIKDSEIDMTLYSYDGNGKFINEKTILMISNGDGQEDPAGGILSRSENSVADVMNGNVDDFEAMLNNLTSLDELKVSYKNSEGVRYVSNIHELAETFVDPDVHHVMLTSSMISNAELTFDNDTMYIDGQNNTYTGDMKLLNTGAAVARMSDIEVDGKITVDVSSQGKAYFENVTADEIKIISSDNQNCVHISNSDVEKVTVANNTNVKVIIEGTTQIDQMDIMPKAAANKVEIVNASTVGDSAVTVINVKNVDTDSPVIKLSGEFVDPNVPSDIKTDVEQDTSAVDDGTKSDLEIMTISDCTGKEIEEAGGLRIVLRLDGESKFDTSKTTQLIAAVNAAVGATTPLEFTGNIANASVSFIGSDKIAVIIVPASEFVYGNLTTDEVEFTVESSTLVTGIDDIVSGTVEAGSSLEDDITFDVSRSADLTALSINSQLEDATGINLTLTGATNYTIFEYIVAANQNSITGSWTALTDANISGVAKADNGKYLYIRQKTQTGNMRQLGRIIGLDTTAPTITSVVLTDADADGVIETATVTFSEEISDAAATAYVAGNGTNTIGGQAITNVATGSAADDEILIFTTADGGAIGTGVVDLLLAEGADGLNITDIAGNDLADVTPSTVTETDKAGPVVLTAVFDDSATNDGNIENGEKITITFSEDTNEAAVTTAAAIDALLDIDTVNTFDTTEHTVASSTAVSATWTDAKTLEVTFTTAGAVDILAGDFIKAKTGVTDTATTPNASPTASVTGGNALAITDAN